MRARGNDFRESAFKKRDSKFEQKKFGKGGRTFAFNENFRNNHNHFNHNKGFNKPFKANNPSQNQNNGEAQTDYRILYDKVVDSITIHYAEWSYLQFMSK